MEMIKDIIRQFYPLLITLACVSFVIGVFFLAPINNGTGIFQGSGNMYAPMLDESKKTDAGELLENEKYIPEIVYNAGSQKIGTNTIFKELLSVKLKSGEYVSGTKEEEFAIYLADITDEYGNTVLETLNTEEIEQLEEIPAPFVYNKEEDRLYFYSSGIYIIKIHVYGTNGEMEAKEFLLPIEA